VLGCRLRFERFPRRSGSGSRALVGAAARRAATAAAAYFARSSGALVLTSGGRAWADVVEADAIARALQANGVPSPSILRERLSHSTRENARYAGELLRARGVDAIELVTCAFHMPRARLLFEHEGFTVAPRPAVASPSDGASRAGAFARLWRLGRERGALFVDERFVRRVADSRVSS
jgi:uncharacterized SAM-binding protein YcdF (DUF218 family)